MLILIIMVSFHHPNARVELRGAPSAPLSAAWALLKAHAKTIVTTSMDVRFMISSRFLFIG
jgi:hypothetical protein